MAGVVRGLYLVNGGGSVALLGFAQSLVPNRLDLVAPVITGLIPLAIGLTVAVFVHFFRYHASFKNQAGDSSSWKMYWFLYQGASCVSAVSFLAGALIVAVGILCRL